MGKISDDGLVRKQVKEPIVTFSSKETMQESKIPYNINDNKARIAKFSDSQPEKITEEIIEIPEREADKINHGRNQSGKKQLDQPPIATQENKIETPPTSITPTQKQEVKRKKRTKKIIKQEFIANHYTTNWISLVSITMFLITFYSSFFGLQQNVSISFVKSCFTLLVVYLILKSLVFLWNFIIPRDQWQLIVHGPPQTESRTEMKIRKAREALQLLELEREKELNNE